MTPKKDGNITLAQTILPDAALPIDDTVGSFSFFERSGTGNFIVDADTEHFVQVNQTLSEISGYSTEELHQLTPFDITHFVDRESYHDKWAQHLQKQDTHFETEQRYVRKDGTVLYARTVHTIVSDKAGRPRYLLGVVQNINTHQNTLEFLERALFEISDQERRGIGQQLHDNLCQHLLGAAFAAKAIAGDLERERSPSATQLHELARLINDAVIQARHVARRLNPIELDSGSLMSALEELVHHVSCSITCKFICEKPILIENIDQARHAYQITKSAITEASQKSGITRIVVQLDSTDQDIILRVTDNGFNPCELLSNPLGASAKLLNSRVRAINGRLTIEEQPNRGAVLTCIFPILP